MQTLLICSSAAGAHGQAGRGNLPSTANKEIPRGGGGTKSRQHRSCPRHAMPQHATPRWCLRWAMPPDFSPMGEMEHQRAAKACGVACTSTDACMYTVARTHAPAPHQHPTDNAQRSPAPARLPRPAVGRIRIPQPCGTFPAHHSASLREPQEWGWAGASVRLIKASPRWGRAAEVASRLPLRDRCQGGFAMLMDN